MCSCPLCFIGLVRSSQGPDLHFSFPCFNSFSCKQTKLHKLKKKNRVWNVVIEGLLKLPGFGRKSVTSFPILSCVSIFHVSITHPCSSFPVKSKRVKMTFLIIIIIFDFPFCFHHDLYTFVFYMQAQFLIGYYYR